MVLCSEGFAVGWTKGKICNLLPDVTRQPVPSSLGNCLSCLLSSTCWWVSWVSRNKCFLWLLSRVVPLGMCWKLRLVLSLRMRRKNNVFLRTCCGSRLTEMWGLCHQCLWLSNHWAVFVGSLVTLPQCQDTFYAILRVLTVPLLSQ